MTSLPAIVAPRPKIPVKVLMPLPPRGFYPDHVSGTMRPLPDGYFFDRETGEPCRVSPQGWLEPPNVGAFFFDKQNGVFYRADGPTAFDWGLVTPAELPGCMVRSVIDFPEPAHHAMSGPELEEVGEASKVKPGSPPHIVDEGRMSELGLRMRDTRYWEVGGVRVMQTRVRLEAHGRCAAFVGFASRMLHSALPVALLADDEGFRVYDPSAVGVAFDDEDPDNLYVVRDGAAMIGPATNLRRWTAVRVEVTVSGHASTYVRPGAPEDEGESGVRRLDSIGPRVSLFRYGRQP